mmetsp:Transcript_26225/g.49581  ORF Transcript_26225/g.49581 Transcript_26225/m.49581 type:complete len:265 (+) Transcript_26225:2398-3192(+)
MRERLRNVADHVVLYLLFLLQPLLFLLGLGEFRLGRFVLFGPLLERFVIVILRILVLLIALFKYLQGHIISALLQELLLHTGGRDNVQMHELVLRPNAAYVFERYLVVQVGLPEEGMDLVLVDALFGSNHQEKLCRNDSEIIPRNATLGGLPGDAATFQDVLRLGRAVSLRLRLSLGQVQRDVLEFPILVEDCNFFLLLLFVLLVISLVLGIGLLALEELATSHITAVVVVLDVVVVVNVLLYEPALGRVAAGLGLQDERKEVA